jgi:hypothetical protein
MASETDVHIRVGDQELVPIDGSIRTSLSDLPEATFVLDAAALAANPVDYLLPVTIVGERPGPTLSIIDARPEGDRVTLKCRGSVSLLETLAPDGESQDCSHLELVYAAARGAGFPEDRIFISGLDTLRNEEIEVAVPLIGVEVANTTTSIGRVQLVSPAAGAELLERFHPRPDLAAEWEAGLSFARVQCEAARLYDAEQEGLAQIEAALSWLIVRANYGFAVTPSGELLPFDRGNAIARPRRLPVIAAYGTVTPRRWLRRPPAQRVESRMVIDSHSRLDVPSVPAGLEASDANALSAARRALEPGDLALRGHAFWEAFEFYVARYSSPSLFNATNRQAILDAAGPGLSPTQQTRLTQLVNGPLNDTPLLDKLLATLTSEGIQPSDEDTAVLRRLRKARNRTMHGRHAEASLDDMQHGCALLTRALVMRVDRSS